MMSALIPALIVVITVAGMELIAAWMHEHVMHGPGWGWHKSHHVPHDDAFELNDLYALVFAVLSVLLFAVGSYVWAPVWWVGVGTCIYGVLYFFLHDVLVHKRWPFRHVPRRGYLRRIYQAHRLHHAVEGRDGAVSFGFILVRRPEELKRELREKRSQADWCAATTGGSAAGRAQRPARDTGLER